MATIQAIAESAGEVDRQVAATRAAAGDAIECAKRLRVQCLLLKSSLLLVKVFVDKMSQENRETAIRAIGLAEGAIESVRVLQEEHAAPG
jgi:hypothetical protein